MEAVAIEEEEVGAKSHSPVKSKAQRDKRGHAL